MRNKYNVELYTWGYHMVREDQAGSRTKRFCLPADTFDDAVQQAKLVLAGIKSNPSVWEAGINSVSLVEGADKEYPTLEAEMRRSNGIGRND